ncbi:hypothetical protein MHBO_000305 [Bonamia ostreae]|uniref:Uncharacterized protein n=1 Tax=Bonamia ostreae TaxID=126728 RepID=A0ABV2AG10_9EUKA
MRIIRSYKYIENNIRKVKATMNRYYSVAKHFGDDDYDQIFDSMERLERIKKGQKQSKSYDFSPISQKLSSYIRRLRNEEKKEKILESCSLDRRDEICSTNSTCCPDQIYSAPNINPTDANVCKNEAIFGRKGRNEEKLTEDNVMLQTIIKELKTLVEKMEHLVKEGNRGNLNHFRKSRKVGIVEQIDQKFRSCCEEKRFLERTQQKKTGQNEPKDAPILQTEAELLQRRIGKTIGRSTEVTKVL